MPRWTMNYGIGLHKVQEAYKSVSLFVVAQYLEEEAAKNNETGRKHLSRNMQSSNPSLAGKKKEKTKGPYSKCH